MKGKQVGLLVGRNVFEERMEYNFLKVNTLELACL